MTADAVLSVRLSTKTKKHLDQLAQRTKRTKSFLAAEAIDAYVARELAIIEAIQRGLDDVKVGRVVPHRDAVKRINATIGRFSKSRA